MIRVNEDSVYGNLTSIFGILRGSEYWSRNEKMIFSLLRIATRIAYNEFYTFI